MTIFINQGYFLNAMEEINVSVFIDRENKTKKIKIKNNSSVLDLLKKLKINPVAVIVSRNNGLLLEDERLGDNDEIRILSVISGG